MPPSIPPATNPGYKTWENSYWATPSMLQIQIGIQFGRCMIGNLSKQILIAGDGFFCENSPSHLQIYGVDNGNDELIPCEFKRRNSSY